MGKKSHRIQRKMKTNSNKRQSGRRCGLTGTLETTRGDSPRRGVVSSAGAFLSCRCIDDGVRRPGMGRDRLTESLYALRVCIVALIS